MKIILWLAILINANVLFTNYNMSCKPLWKKNVFTKFIVLGQSVWHVIDVRIMCIGPKFCWGPTHIVTKRAVNPKGCIFIPIEQIKEHLYSNGQSNKSITHG